MIGAERFARAPVAGSPGRRVWRCRNVYVLGTGHAEVQAAIPTKTVPELGGDAVESSRSRTPASRFKDVEMFACGNLGIGPTARWSASASSSNVGQTGIPAVNVANACATGSTAFREAYLWPSRLGDVPDLALAVGVEQMGKQGLLGGGGGGKNDPAYSAGRQARVGPDARGVRAGRHRAHAPSTAPRWRTWPRSRSRAISTRPKIRSHSIAPRSASKT